MHIRPTCTLRSAAVAAALTVLLTLSCNKDSPPSAPGSDVNTPTAVTVVQTTPGGGATDVLVGTDVSATFSRPVDTTTISPSSFYLTPAVSGSITVSSNRTTVTFQPSSALSPSTSYTATLTTAIRDTMKTSLESNYTWSFTTKTQVVQAVTMPLTAGKRWMYDATYHQTFTGGSGESFSGSYALYVARTDASVAGRSAAEMLLLKLDTGGSTEVQQFFLAQDADGLMIAYSATGSWYRAYSLNQLSFTSSGFLFRGSGSSSAPATQSMGTVSVPAGTYSALTVDYHQKQTGQYEMVNYWDDRKDSYADGVGLVKSWWTFLVINKDPQYPDLDEAGNMQLRYVDAGPFPELVNEAEPNDSYSSPTLSSVSIPGVFAGDAALQDAGEVVAGTLVQPDANGVRQIQDWYKFTGTLGSTVRIYMSFADYRNDLDIYVFIPSPQGLRLAASSTNDKGNPEEITFTMNAGSYLVGVQAYNTPGGRDRYWIVIR